MPLPLLELGLIDRQAPAIGLCHGAAGPDALIEIPLRLGCSAAVSLEIRGFNDALLKTPDHCRNHTVLEGISLMPSESGSFPDLVGWHHGYLPPHLCRSSRRGEKRPAAELITPLLTTAIEENGVVPRSENGNGESPDCTPSEQEVKRKQETRHIRVVRQLVISAIRSAAEALRRLQAATGTRAPSKGRERLAIEQNGVVPRSENGNGESPVSTPSEQEVKGKQDTRHNRVVRQLVIPAIWSAGAEALRQLQIAIGTRAPSESRERLGDEKASGADHSRSSRVALPVLPQRSPTEMRAKIQVQDVARPRPTMRPRTPARGMTIARPLPIVSEATGPAPSPRLAAETVPRHRFVNLGDFMTCEAIAVGVLMLSMGLGFSRPLEDSPLSSVFKVVAVAAAIVATILPIILLWWARRTPAED